MFHSKATPDETVLPNSDPSPLDRVAKLFLSPRPCGFGSEPTGQQEPLALRTSLWILIPTSDISAGHQTRVRAHRPGSLSQRLVAVIEVETIRHVGLRFVFPVIRIHLFYICKRNILYKTYNADVPFYE